MSTPVTAPVRQTPLVTQVAEQFRTLVETGTWAVGSKIPGENQLAADLGVSRGTVREALRALSLAGLLDPRVGDGTYVTARDELTAILVRDRTTTDLGDTLDVRSVLDSAAARRAATRATPEHVARLADALTARDVAHDAGDEPGYVAADAAFHRAVVAASGSPLLLRLHDAIEEVLTAGIAQTTTLPEDPRLRRLHADLVTAITDTDADRAEAVALDLVDEVAFLGSLGAREQAAE